MQICDSCEQVYGHNICGGKLNLNESCIDKK